jgi:putative ABC transport system permease protein
MDYVLETLWQQRQRYFPAILAVAFSALLIALQCGLLLGLLSIKSAPVDRSRADLWVTSPDVQSVDMGQPIPEHYLSRLASQPEVMDQEVYLQGFAYWAKPAGGTELCMVVGTRLEEGALGTITDLTPELRARLAEPDTIAVDESDLEKLGIQGVGDTARIDWRPVQVVGVVRGLPSFAGPYVLCSLRTARPLLQLQPDQTIYLLGRCRDPADAPAVVQRLGAYEGMTAFTREEFSRRTRWHWLTTTKGGIALGYTAVLGLLVGAVVTSQTLYAATASSFRQYATLRALGIPRWRIVLAVLAQAFCVGVAGVALALPFAFVLAGAADWLGVRVLLPVWLLGLAAVVTLAMAMGSGLVALRALRTIQMVTLLR